MLKVVIMGANVLVIIGTTFETDIHMTWSAADEIEAVDLFSCQFAARDTYRHALLQGLFYGQRITRIFTLTELTHLSLDKMAAILADDNFRYIFLNEKDRTPIWLKFVHRSPTNRKPALFQVMAWRRTGHKPLPELMLTQFSDAYMRH